MQMVSRIVLSTFMIAMIGCGVKGRPTPPTHPSPIGRGEPVFKDSKKSNQKTTIPSLEPKTGE
ncbi:hypothetical protein BDW_00185 [Bdellovibrio bacteriovorus W]|nr:hypothetical protein BDW_00185 [Bdellovibrio bacteriovorus W]